MNPELRRQLWLNVSTPRLVALFLVIALLVILVGVSSDWNRTDLASWLLAIGVALSAGVGASAAAESMLSEVRFNTWDWQRLSALGPWQMSWGKLVGSTLLSFYGSTLCYVAFLFVADWHAAPVHPVLVVTLALLLGGLAQAGSLLGACGSLFRARHAAGVGHVALGLVAGAPALWAVMAIVHERQPSPVRWYEIELSRFWLTALSAAAFFGWALLGVYRMLRSQLQLRSAPWVWVTFVLFTAGYVAGFVPHVPATTWSERMLWRVFLADAIVVTWAYGAVVASTMETMQIHRMLLLLEHAGWRRAAVEMPAWLGTLALSTVTTVATLVLARHFTLEKVIPVGPTCVGMFALLVRDSLFIFLFRLRARSVNADLWLALILACSHVVIPLILDAADLDALRAPFSLYPRGGWTASGVLLVEAGVLWAIVRRDWLRYTRLLTAP